MKDLFSSFFQSIFAVVFMLLGIGGLIMFLGMHSIDCKHENMQLERKNTKLIELNEGQNKKLHHQELLNSQLIATLDEVNYENKTLMEQKKQINQQITQQQKLLRAKDNEIKLIAKSLTRSRDSTSSWKAKARSLQVTLKKSKVEQKKLYTAYQLEMTNNEELLIRGCELTNNNNALLVELSNSQEVIDSLGRKNELLTTLSRVNSESSASSKANSFQLSLAFVIGIIFQFLFSILTRRKGKKAIADSENLLPV